MTERRAIVAELMERGISERQACHAVGLGRSSYRYQARPASERDQQLQQAIVTLAQHHRRYGYRRITAVLRRRGERVNPKRVHRIWQAKGLQLPRTRPRKRHARSGVVPPTRATHRGHVWTVDFVFDRTARGRVLKLLIVLDEHTRECHRIVVGDRLDSRDVVDLLTVLMAEQGTPEHLRSDNGGEFIAGCVQQWLTEQQSQAIAIAPGHPWENGYAESFIGKLRDECLNEEVFWSARHAQAVVEWWRRAYNEERPHSSLDYRTPAEAAGRARSLKEGTGNTSGG